MKSPQLPLSPAESPLVSPTPSVISRHKVSFIKPSDVLKDPATTTATSSFHHSHIREDTAASTIFGRRANSVVNTPALRTFQSPRGGKGAKQRGSPIFVTLDQRSTSTLQQSPRTAITVKQDREIFVQSALDKLEVHQIMGKCDNLAKEYKFGKTNPGRDADLSCALERYRHSRLTETTECLEAVCE